MTLILASTSPYRKALLEQLQLPFKTVDSEVNEEKYKREIKDPHQLTKTLALKKAMSVFEKNPEAIVIGGDQVSLFHGEILGKPGTKQKAEEQLHKLQGNKHQLVTATCLKTPQQTFEWTEVIDLTMRKLSPDQIRKYVEIEEPLFCAGSYKIESLGINLFESIQCSDHTAIVGMPLIKLGTYLRECGLDPLD